MPDYDIGNRLTADASLELIISLSPVIEALGSDDFYYRLSDAIARFLDTGRFLTIRYARFARPKFLVNEAMNPEAVQNYLNEYYRIDPLLRMVRDEATRPVVTFKELRRNGSDNLFYDEMYRTAEIKDELIFLLPTIGGVFTAICIDRARRYFSEAEILRARLIFPTLCQIHELHIRQTLYGRISSDFNRGEIATLVIDAEGVPLFRNTSWTDQVDPSDEKELCNLVVGCANGTERFGSASVLHWESFPFTNAIAPGGKVVMLEDSSPGYLDLTSEQYIQRFCMHYSLTRREQEIVSLTLQGETTARIAETLDISVGTVRNHKYRLYYKLDITTERELFCTLFQARDFL